MFLILSCTPPHKLVAFNFDRVEIKFYYYYLKIVVPLSWRMDVELPYLTDAGFVEAEDKTSYILLSLS